MSQQPPPQPPVPASLSPALELGLEPRPGTYTAQRGRHPGRGSREEWGAQGAAGEPGDPGAGTNNAALLVPGQGQQDARAVSSLLTPSTGSSRGLRGTQIALGHRQQQPGPQQGPWPSRASPPPHLAGLALMPPRDPYHRPSHAALPLAHPGTDARAVPEAPFQQAYLQQQGRTLSEGQGEGQSSAAGVGLTVPSRSWSFGVPSTGEEWTTRRPALPRLQGEQPWLSAAPMRSRESESGMQGSAMGSVLLGPRESHRHLWGASTTGGPSALHPSTAPNAHRARTAATVSPLRTPAASHLGSTGLTWHQQTLALVTWDPPVTNAATMLWAPEQRVQALRLPPLASWLQQHVVEGAGRSRPQVPGTRRSWVSRPEEAAGSPTGPTSQTADMGSLNAPAGGRPAPLSVDPSAYGWSSALLGLPGPSAASQSLNAAPPGLNAPPPGLNAPPPGLNAPPPGLNAPPPSQNAAPPGLNASPKGLDAAPLDLNSAPAGMHAGPIGINAAPSGVLVSAVTTHTANLAREDEGGDYAGGVHTDGAAAGHWVLGASEGAAGVSAEESRGEVRLGVALPLVPLVRSATAPGVQGDSGTLGSSCLMLLSGEGCQTALEETNPSHDSSAPSLDDEAQGLLSPCRLHQLKSSMRSPRVPGVLEAADGKQGTSNQRQRKSLEPRAQHITGVAAAEGTASQQLHSWDASNNPVSQLRHPTPVCEGEQLLPKYTPEENKCGALGKRKASVATTMSSGTPDSSSSGRIAPEGALGNIETNLLQLAHSRTNPPAGSQGTSPRASLLLPGSSSSIPAIKKPEVPEGSGSASRSEVERSSLNIYGSEMLRPEAHQMPETVPGLLYPSQEEATHLQLCMEEADDSSHPIPLDNIPTSAERAGNPKI